MKIMNSLTNLIPNRVAFSSSRQMLILKKNSPTIFFGLGIAATTTGTVLACRATLRLPEVLEQTEKNIATLKKAKEVNDSVEDGVLYPDEVYHRDAVQVYTKSALEIGKLYGPSILVSVAGIAMLTKSKNILEKRNAALMAAYTTVAKAFEEYRERVRDQLGEDRELDFYRGTRREVVKNELGEKTEVEIVEPGKGGPYQRIFDDISPYWQKDAELNRMFLEGQRYQLNLKLKQRGHMLLNDVFDPACTHYHEDHLALAGY